MGTRVLFVGALITACSLAQTPAAKKSPQKKSAATEQIRRTKPEALKVHSDTWEEGEIKSCATYAGEPFIVFCDYLKASWEGSLIKLVLANREGNSEEEAYELAFIDAHSHSREFTVQFTNDLARDPNPWPDWQALNVDASNLPLSERISKRAANPARRKLSGWHCTKEKVISCTLSGITE